MPFSGRPRGWLTRLLERLDLVGPFPDDSRVSGSAEEFRDVPARAPIAVLAVVFTYAAVIGATFLVPDLAISPVSAVSGPDLGSVITTVVAYGLVAVLGFFVIRRLLRRRHGGRSVWTVLCQAALTEELIFRYGHETWSRPQRIKAAAAFGAAHVINLIYTLITCAVLIGVGMIYAAVYRAELRTTGDRRRAVLVAAKCHALANAVILGVLAVLVMMLVSADLITLLS